MKKIKINSYSVIFYTVTLLSFTTTHCIAQAPQAIPYQAVARNASGNLIASQAVSVRFSIIDSIATGTVVYSETFHPTTNTLGLFSLNIGQGTVVSGSFAAINWGTNNKFLKVELDPAGGSSYNDMGTTQLMSVPYALYSESTGDSSTWRKKGQDIYFNNGNVGIGITTPSEKLDVTGNIHTNGGYFKTSCPGTLTNLATNETSSLIYDSRNAGTSYPFLNSGNLILQSWSQAEREILLVTGVTPIARVTVGSNSSAGIVKIMTSDIAVETIGSGVILKSPNGNCWRVTIDNSGNLIRTAITCP